MFGIRVYHADQFQISIFNWEYMMLQMILYNIDDCLIWNFIIRKNLLPIPFFSQINSIWNEFMEFIFGKRIRRGKNFHDINTSTTFQRSIIILYVYRASSYFQTGTEINRRNIEYFADNISFESRRNIDIFLNKELMAGQIWSTKTNFV